MNKCNSEFCTLCLSYGCADMFVLTVIQTSVLIIHFCLIIMAYCEYEMPTLLLIWLVGPAQWLGCCSLAG